MTEEANRTNGKILLTGYNTKGVPEDISPFRETQGFQSVRTKDYLTNLVTEVIRQKRDHVNFDDT